MDFAVVRDWLRFVHPGVGCIGLVAFPRRKTDPQRPRTARIEIEDEEDPFRAATGWLLRQHATSIEQRNCSPRVRHASFRPSNNWKARNVDWACTFIVDIDTHTAQQLTALPALLADTMQRLPKVNVPPPSMVMFTGWGVHLLWVVDQPLEQSRWRAVASALNTALAKAEVPFERGTLLDPSCSLRPPGSINWRDPAAPREVRILQQGQKYPIDVFAPLEPIPSSRSLDRFKVAPQTGVSLIPSLAPVLERCRILAHIAETHGAECSEPAWRATLQLAAFAEDGREYIHALSDGHEDYQPHETETKFDYILASRDEQAFGPHTCEHLRAVYTNGPAFCRECPFNGKVKSPIQAPTVVRATRAPTEASAPSPRTTTYEDPEVIIYNDATNGPFGRFGMYLRTSSIKSQDGGTTVASQDLVRLADWYMTEVELHDFVRPDGTGQSILRGTVWQHKCVERPVSFDMANLYDQRTVRAHVARSGLSRVSDPDAFLRYLERLRHFKRVERGDAQTVQAYGWTQVKGKRGFAYGNKLFLPDDQVIGCVASSELLDLNEEYRASGSLRAWRDIVDRVCHDRRPAVHAVLGVAAAGPLVAFSGLMGLIVLLRSSRSGVGKTTLLRIAQSVWGSGKGIHKVTDTHNAVMRKLGQLRHLPLVRDEFQLGSDVTAAVQSVFSYEGGMEKARMTAAGQLQSRGSWQSFVIMASNLSMWELMSMLSARQAGFLRMLELNIESTDVAGVDIQPEDLAVLDEHFGVGGERLIKAYVNHQDAILPAIKAARQGLIAALDKAGQALTPDEINRLRFLLMSAALGMIGGQFARQHGVLPYWRSDLAARAYVRSLSKACNMLRRDEGSTTMLALLRAFISAHSALLLQRMAGATGVVMPPMTRNMPPVGEVDLERGEVVLLYSAMRQWLDKTRQSHLPGAEVLLHEMPEVHRQIGAGSAFVLPRQRVIVVTLAQAGLGKGEPDASE